MEILLMTFAESYDFQGTLLITNSDNYYRLIFHGNDVKLKIWGK